MSKQVRMIVLVVAISMFVVGAIALRAAPSRAQGPGVLGAGCAECGAGQGSTMDGRGLGNGRADCGVGQGGPMDGSGAGYRGGQGRAAGGLSGWSNSGQMQGGTGSGSICTGCSENAVAGSLTEAEANALRVALEDERTAKALYEKAISQFGGVRPLTSIVRAEDRHIDALERLFTRYGLEIPTDDTLVPDVTFVTPADACAAGVATERANVVLYDELLAQVSNAELIRVFTSLQKASQNQHLPALEQCAS